MNPTQDAFVGTWELDPESLEYQHGRPGLRATYTIEALPEGLQFTLDGNDADGEPLKFTYGGELNGSEYPLPGTDAVLVLTRYGDRIIESALKRDGKVVDRWTRELLPDLNTIRITQHGWKPDGSPFQNVSLYHRVK